MSVTTVERVDHTNKQEVMSVSAGIAAVAADINHEHGRKMGGVGTALPPNWTADDVSALTERIGDRGAVLHCRDGGEVVAFAIVQPDPAENGTAIMGVWVREDHRRKGLGTALARAGTEFARDAGYAKLRGTIPAYNAPALSFFSAIGPIVQLGGGGISYELPV